MTKATLQTAKARTAKPKPVSGTHVYCGTSGWAYTTWKPGFYPADVSSKKFLAHYGTRLNSVEVNYTFTKLPTSQQLQDWLAATPPDFRFTFKAPQRITHMKRLLGCEELLAEFVESLAPVRKAKRMGAVLFQTPPNFKFDMERLAEFLALPPMKTLRQTAWEFRNPAWFCDDLYKLLRRKKAALCIAETETLDTPEVMTAPYRYYRLRKPGGYNQAEAKTLAAKFAALQEETYVYFMHEDEPTGPIAAEMTLSMVGTL